MCASQANELSPNYENSQYFSIELRNLAEWEFVFEDVNGRIKYPLKVPFNFTLGKFDVSSSFCVDMVYPWLKTAER